ncbi:zinc ribbon domain-containing protein [Natrinema salaciae]|uniref:Uncharacterized protein n=1 Tax=Natrinema salaciae TaxID=1186196 RepID=A0A1H9M9I4_9EURY|nr:hypothetical protein [Natrinema salaciae]SER20125.1 hypothetical protein SAMN04489841_3259 [Natrinema salaciae]
MRLPIRSGTDHGTLVLLELGAVPVALLVTFFTLALAELVAAVVGVALDAAGASETIPEIATVVIGFGALVVLVTGGGHLVTGYRHCFESWFDDVSPLPVLLVPVVGIVVPIGYAFWQTGSLRPSSWLLLPVAVSANALAFRTIAIDSLREDRGRTSFVAGSLTALPAVAVLVDLAGEMLGSGRPVVRTTDAVAVGWSSPAGRAAVIAVPLSVAVLYGVGTVYSRQSRWEPDWLLPKSSDAIAALTSRARSLPRPGAVFVALTSRARSLPRPGAVFVALTSRDGSEPSGRQPTGAGRASSNAARSGDRSTARQRSGTAREVVPSSPGTDAAPRGGASSPGTDDSSSPAEATTDASADDDRSASAEETSDEREQPASAPLGGPGAAASTVEKDGTDVAAGTDGTASDTRIFVDDFDQYVPDETPVETCPDCEEEIPSDGVYNFCPFCGGEL